MDFKYFWKGVNTPHKKDYEGLVFSTWKASRKYQEEYSEEEFCRDMAFLDGECFPVKKIYDAIKANGYKIVKDDLK